jgi:hypothetical protein
MAEPVQCIHSPDECTLAFQIIELGTTPVNHFLVSQR